MSAEIAANVSLLMNVRVDRLRRCCLSSFLVVLAVSAAWPVVAADLRELTTHPSLDAAVADAAAQAASSAPRRTFFPVAIFHEKDFGRGAALAAFSRKDPVRGDCREIYIAYYTTGTKNPGFVDSVRLYCPEGADGAYRQQPDVITQIQEPRLNRARSFIPPTLKPGTVWRIENTEERKAHSQAAAIAMAIGNRTSPATVTFEEAAARGAVHVSEMNGCRRVVGRIDPPPVDRPQFVAEYCKGPQGWQISRQYKPDPEEKASAERALDETIAQTKWSGISERPVARAADPTRPEPAGGSRDAKRADEVAAAPELAAERPATPTVPEPQPQRQATNQGLANVPEIRIAEQCAAASPLAPWGAAAAAGGGSPRIPEYRASVAHALRSLKLLYGQLSTGQEDGLDKLWAPFFDHPTVAAQTWFGRINPLLDEYLATLAELDAVFPEFRDATADVLIASATASQNYYDFAAPTAYVLGARIESAQKKLKQLNDDIAALGDAPNPLAEKCAAQARHRKAIGSGHDLLALLQKSKFVFALDGKPKKDGDILGIGDVAVQVTFYGAKNEPSLATKVAEGTPAVNWQWNGRKFSYTSKQKYFDAPCTTYADGVRSSQDQTTLQGEVSPDGTRITNLRGVLHTRFCKDAKSGTVEESRVDTDLPEAVATIYRGKPIHSGPQQIEIIYTNKELVLPADFDKWEPRAGDVLVRFANFLMTNKPMNFCGVSSAVAIGAGMGCLLANDKEACQRQKKEAEKQNELECKAKFAAWTAGADYLSAASSRASGGEKGTAKDASAKPSASDEEAQATAEAIAHHESIAAQVQRNADRWLDDARREKDPGRRAELEKRALEVAANAQAERDIASSLRSGALVKTRTDWDKRQSAAIVEKIRDELDQFSQDNQRLARINRILLADQGHSSEGMQQRISDALKSPNRVAELEKIEIDVDSRVRARKAQEQVWREKEKELADWELQRPVELTKQTVNAAVTLTAMAVPGAGPLAIAWGLGSGFAEGGAGGAVKAGFRMYSPYLDVAAATYEGAREGGLWGAAKGGVSAAAMNAFMGKVTPRLQKALSGAPNVPKIPAARRPAAEVEIHTAEQRHQLALAKAKTPEQIAQVKKQYETIEMRNAMKQERQQAIERADKAAAAARKPDGTVDTGHPEYKRAMEQLKADMARTHEKFAGRENRDLLHGEAIQAAGLAENDVKLSGGKPKNAMSDLDVTASNHDAGKRYVKALTEKSGLSAVEYGDRWVLSNDTTVWKPTASAKAGSSAFEAEVAFGASKGSDKFATPSGQKITKGEASGDKLGGVIDNFKKAGEAGLGSKGDKDLHVIGKSADKAVEIAAGSAPDSLRKQWAGLRAHQTPEEAGIVTLGASPQEKAKQTREFLRRTQSEMAKAFRSAKQTSDSHERALLESREAARKSGDMKQVAKIQEELAIIRSSNRVALARVADVAPELVADAGGAGMPTSSKAKAWVPVSVLLERERKLEGKVDLQLKGNDPALGDLGERCKEGAKRVEERLKAAKAGSEEAKYLAELKAGLDRGAVNPAEGIQQVRLVSGYELAAVLRQLGIAPKKK